MHIKPNTTDTMTDTMAKYYDFNSISKFLNGDFGVGRAAYPSQVLPCSHAPFSENEETGI